MRCASTSAHSMSASWTCGAHTNPCSSFEIRSEAIDESSGAHASMLRSVAASMANPSCVRIEEPASRVVGDGVHREVAAIEVGGDVPHECDGVGVAGVGIRPIDAIGGDFDRFAVDDHGDGAVLHSRFVRAIARLLKRRLRFLPRGRRGDVDIA